MIFQNQQANIFKVNGAIADQFANRPASIGSYYIFYSLDTQEIYYDDTSGWILLGSGGGAGVNIYTSDGTLTGNRTLTGANNNLTFTGTNDFSLFANGDILLNAPNNGNITLDNTFGVGGNININGGINTQISGGGTGEIIFNSALTSIYSSYLSNIAGFELNFFNNRFRFGRIAGTNPLNITIFSNTRIIDIRDNNLVQGFSLNFANQLYDFGQISTGNLTRLQINDQNQIIQTNNFFIPNSGLYLDFNSQTYRLGNAFGVGNAISFQVNNPAQIIRTIKGLNEDGLKIDLINNVFEFGRISTGNRTNIVIFDTGFLQAKFNNNVDGININFNGSYSFGKLTSTNSNYINFQPSGQILTYRGGINNGINFDTQIFNYKIGAFDPGTNQTIFEIDDFNSFIKTTYQTNDVGLKLDFANNNFSIGDQSNGDLFLLDVNNAILKTQYSFNDIGLKLDFANSIYQLGQITGGNATYITIDDAAAFPIQFDGTNVLQGTSGAVSGQHLKVNVNGTNYVIELKNP